MNILSHFIDLFFIRSYNYKRGGIMSEIRIPTQKRQFGKKK